MTSRKEAGLYLKAEKCEFHREQVKSLGLIVEVNGIRMDPEKIQAVEIGKPRRNSMLFRLLEDLQTFTGRS
jgi:hypothetical protein